MFRPRPTFWEGVYSYRLKKHRGGGHLNANGNNRGSNLHVCKDARFGAEKSDVGLCKKFDKINPFPLCEETFHGWGGGGKLVAKGVRRSAKRWAPYYLMFCSAAKKKHGRSTAGTQRISSNQAQSGSRNPSNFICDPPCNSVCLACAAIT